MNFFIAEASTSIGGKRSSSSTINSPRASTSKGSLETIGPGGPSPVKYQKLCTETNQNLSKSANEIYRDKNQQWNCQTIWTKCMLN